MTVDKPWTNRGTTYRIVVERPRIVVEQPRIVVDTPQKITQIVLRKCFTSINTFLEMASELHVRAGSNI